MSPPPSQSSRPDALRPRPGWYTTAATAAAAAAVLLLAALRTHNIGLLVGSLLIVSGSVTALVEAFRVRPPRNGASSSAAVGILAGLTLAGAVICLLAVLIRPGA